MLTQIIQFLLMGTKNVNTYCWVKRNLSLQIISCMTEQSTQTLLKPKALPVWKHDSGFSGLKMNNRKN